MRDENGLSSHPSPDTVIEHTKKIIYDIQSARKSDLLVLISHRTLDIGVVLSINSIMREMGRAGRLKKLDVLLDSG